MSHLVEKENFYSCLLTHKLLSCLWLLCVFRQNSRPYTPASLMLKDIWHIEFDITVKMSYYNNSSCFNNFLTAGHGHGVRQRHDYCKWKESVFSPLQFESQAIALWIFDIPYAARAFNYTLISFRAFSPRCHPAPSSGSLVLGEMLAEVIIK